MRHRLPPDAFSSRMGAFCRRPGDTGSFGGGGRHRATMGEGVKPFQSRKSRINNCIEGDSFATAACRSSSVINDAR